MRTILFIDDRPIQGMNLANEWSEYYENMWVDKKKPIFYVATLYENTVPEDQNLIKKVVNEKLNKINKQVNNEFFIEINLHQDERVGDREIAKKDIENAIESLLERFKGSDKLLVAIDLILFGKDTYKLKNKECIPSMIIYDMTLKKNINSILYTMYSDGHDADNRWLAVYCSQKDKKTPFILSRENALNYDVLVEVAKEKLDEVIK